MFKLRGGASDKTPYFFRLKNKIMKFSKKVKMIQECSALTQEQQNIIIKNAKEIHAVDLRLCLCIPPTKKDKRKIVGRFMKESGMTAFMCAKNTAFYHAEKGNDLSKTKPEDDCFEYVLSEMIKSEEMLDKLIIFLQKNGKS